MAWQIEFTESAVRQLTGLDKATAKRIVRFLQDRIAPSDNPRSTGKALRGQYGDLWRYRVGDYRLICDIQDERLMVLVVKLGHRRQVYR